MTILDTPRAADAAAATRRTDPVPVSRVDRLIRADDQLSLTLEFLNLDVDQATQTLVTHDPRIAFTGVRLVFGSQHTVEATIGTADPTPTEAVDHRVAAESRLVVPLDPGTPYALKAVLDLASRALTLDDRAIPGRKPGDPRIEPGQDVTALELVDSLVFSPGPDGRFVAGIAPLTHDDVTELWRARLDETGAPATVRAIWSRPGDVPLARPLSQSQRDQIVAATTVDPADPIAVNRLWLTPHGSFIDLAGSWAGIDLAGYLHRATAGRDIHVEVTERGFLAPFGIPATITTVTEREYRDDADGNPVAILVQDDYLSVSPDPLPTLAPHMPDGGRAVPFTEIVAADPGRGPVALAPLTLGDGTQIDPAKIGAVTRDGVQVEMGYLGTDRTGATGIAFSLPAIFVAADQAFTVQDQVNGVTTPLKNLSRFYTEQPAEADLGGQSVGWADPHPLGTASPVRATNLIQFVLDRPDLAGSTPAAVRDELEAAGRPACYPRVASADVVDDAVVALVGGEPITVSYATDWLRSGNRAGNPGLAFLTLARETALDRPGAGRGLVSPSLRIDTLSQTLGSGIALRRSGPPGAGSDAAAGPNDLNWDPAEALGDAAKLFGSIALHEIVEAVNTSLDKLGDETGLPTIKALLEEDGIGYLLSWQPKLKTFRVAGDAVFVVAEDLTSVGLPAFFGAKATSEATIELSQLVPFDRGAATDTDFELTLDNVTVQLPPGSPAIAIAFRRVRYHDPGDGNASLDPDLADWRFIGVLEFLEPVREFIVGLLDLGNVEIDDAGVRADIEIPVPKLSFGVINVTDLRVGLGLDLPNEGSSTISFNLSDRDDPFRITMMGFGGSGSLEVRMVADDLDFLFGSLAVTYELAASIVVASVSLSASLGIDLRYDDSAVTLGAYVELAGNASVLGLVNITGKVLLALSYHLNTKLLRGTASLSAEVESLFGKSETSWRQTVEVSLASDDARRAALGAAETQPSFGDRYSSEQWDTYCAAFR